MRTSANMCGQDRESVAKMDAIQHNISKYETGTRVKQFSKEKHFNARFVRPIYVISTYFFPPALTWKKVSLLIFCFLSAVMGSYRDLYKYWRVGGPTVLSLF